MSISRQYQLMNARKRRMPPHEQPKGADPLVEARAQVKSLELKLARKDDEIARLRREMIKR